MELAKVLKAYVENICNGTNVIRLHEIESLRVIGMMKGK
jgi:hypothetical protein